MWMFYKKRWLCPHALLHVLLFDFPETFCLSLCNLSYSLTFTPSFSCFSSQKFFSQSSSLPPSLLPLPFCSRLEELDVLTRMVPEISAPSLDPLLLSQLTRPTVICPISGLFHGNRRQVSLSPAEAGACLRFMSERSRDVRRESSVPGSLLICGSLWRLPGLDDCFSYIDRIATAKFWLITKKSQLVRTVLIP